MHHAAHATTRATTHATRHAAVRTPLSRLSEGTASSGLAPSTRARATAGLPRRPLLAALTSLALLGLAGPLMAVPDAAAQRQEAQQHFLAAADGNSAHIEPAAEQYTALSAADPSDPVLRAYAGAATSMRANTTMLPWRKMSYAEDGLAQIDKALAQLGAAQERAASPAGVPVALEVRYVAASTFLALPGLFNRGARGEQLLAQVLAAPALAQAPAGFQATVWLYAGRHAVKNGKRDEARQWLQRAADSGVTQQASTARQSLQGL
jgi:hypothetical protein